MVPGCVGGIARIGNQRNVDLHETVPWKKGYQQQVGISTEKVRQRRTTTVQGEVGDKRLLTKKGDILRRSIRSCGKVDKHKDTSLSNPRKQPTCDANAREECLSSRKTERNDLHESS
jgi:hypothetical protein